MPFDRPTLPSLVTRISSDFRSRLGILGAILRRAMAQVLAIVWAGAVHTLHGYLEWVAKQLFAHSAERDYLIKHASLYGITPTPATFATGTVTATGTNSSVIPVNTILVRDDGFTYRVTVEATIASGTATVSVEAKEAGESGNLGAGELLTFESPIGGVNSTVTVTAGGIIGGNDEEGTEEVRDRLILRLREPPQGGSDQDYVGWALAVPGVTRAWVYPHEDGLGTVVVRFVRDNDGSIFPDAGEVTAVQTALDAERPVTAEVTAEAPVALNVAFTIAVVPNTQAVKDAVTAELDDLFFRESEPGDGAGRGTILITAIRTAIGVAEGITDYTLTVPSANVVPTVGQLPVRSTITWA